MQEPCREEVIVRGEWWPWIIEFQVSISAEPTKSAL